MRHMLNFMHIFLIQLAILRKLEKADLNIINAWWKKVGTLSIPVFIDFVYLECESNVKGLQLDSCSVL